MSLRIDVHVHTDGDDHKLDQILSIVKSLKKQGTEIMADLSAITAEVAENGDAVDSAVTLLGQLAQLVRDAGTDPVALEALAADLDAQTNALAEAVVANTPAAP